MQRLDTAVTRLKVSDGEGVYHCMSRTVAGARLWDVQAKETLRRMLWDAAEFSGVQVLAYCIMSNHFHVLVRVPTRPPDDDEELLRRYSILYRNRPAPGFPTPEEMCVIFAEGGGAAERWGMRLRARMADVSEFMKTLKQRFSVWFNRSHDRFGTHWSERFRSVLVEDDPRVLSTVAAYIDLNPVRAGLVEDPMDYRWCSYADAVGDVPAARNGVVALGLGQNWNEAFERYRGVLFGKGWGARRTDLGKINAERVQAVLSRGGKMERHELLRCRLRHLTEGRVFGSEAFVRVAGAALSGANKEDTDDKKIGISAAARWASTNRRLGTIHFRFQDSSSPPESSATSELCSWKAFLTTGGIDPP